MEFTNKISQIDFQQKQTSLFILKNYMFYLLKSQSLNMIISLLTLALTTNLTFMFFQFKQYDKVRERLNNVTRART